MTSVFRHLTDLTDLETALMGADRGPILIFKHSTTCGISAQAHEALSEWLEERASSIPAYLVEVRQHRAVSRAIAERFGVRHESPQALVVEGHTVRWSGSHFHVNAREVEAALQTAAARPLAD